MRHTTVLAGLGLALAATTLTACGSDGSSTATGRTSGGSSSESSSSAYCSELRAEKDALQTVTVSPDVAKLDSVLSSLHGLAGQAPEEVSADWDRLDAAVVAIQDAMAESGVSGADLAKMQKGHMPADVDFDKLADLSSRMVELTSQDLTEAADDIAAHARSECDVDLTAF